MGTRARNSLYVLAVLGAAAGLADARRMIHDFGPRRVPFELQDRPVAPPGARAIAQPTFLTGSPIAALAGGALVIDADSGDLVRVDEAGEPTARLAIGAQASQLVVDPVADRAYIADRAGDRIRIVSLAGGGLASAGAIATDAEPYGLALTPDRKTLLVTAVADQSLTAFDATATQRRWRIALPPEPRAVAVSPDGARAVVTFLNTAAVGLLALDRPGTPALRFQAIGASSKQPRPIAVRPDGRPDHEAGRRHPRAAFAASFIGDRMAVVAHQTSAPKLAADGAEVRGTYGGGGANTMAVDHRITFVADAPPEGAVRRTAQALIGPHQPRALAYDGATDRLYVAGYGSDELLVLEDASRPSIHMRATISIGAGCGPTGLAPRGDQLLVYCSLGRAVATVRTGDAPQLLSTSSPIAKSRLSASARRGRALFRKGNDNRLSGHGVLACSSCHPEGRADGLSWRIQGTSLQTPLLAARIAGTHPFKWDGGDPDIETSLRSTVTRLGGRGISIQDAKDLQAFLEALPRPRRPRSGDPDAVARGKKLFHSEATGCTKCHSGRKLTDRKQHELAEGMDKVDTPSLIGLAISAPYYHDGSAATLRAVLRDKGSVIGMGKTARLTAGEVDDLVAYLRTL